MRLGSGGAESPASSRDGPSLDSLLDAFEESWQGGIAPRLVDFLPAGTEPAVRRELLLDLAKIDLDNRWRRAQGRSAPSSSVQLRDSRSSLTDRPLVEDYLDRYPELGGREQAPIDLIREEYWVRQCWGDRPAHAEYAQRFPGRAAEVAAVLALVDAELIREPVRAAALPAKPVVAAGPEARPIDAIPRFVEALREHRLLRASQLKDLLSADLLGQFSDAGSASLPQAGSLTGVRALARSLIERGWLTPYQANQVLQGNAAALLMGSYVLLERAGEGASGKVFKARHQGMDRVVALKVIRRELLANPEAVQRFYREIQAASRMSHPNVVHAYDAGPIGDTHFLAMEFVEGTNLHRLATQSGSLPVEQVCDYVRQAALGLQHAFLNGLVHRDVKPSNLLIAEASSQSGTRNLQAGKVKILDLGMARWEGPLDERGNGPLTEDGTVMGTPDFMSPEQVQDARAVDVRSDLYSLGCTFFFLLTGEVPFPRKTFIAKADAHRFEAPRPVTQLRPEVPVWVEEVVTRLMAKRPEDRYQTPQELADVLAAGLGIQNTALHHSSGDWSLSQTVLPTQALPAVAPPAPPHGAVMGVGTVVQSAPGAAPARVPEPSTSRLPLVLKLSVCALALSVLALFATPFFLVAKKPQTDPPKATSPPPAPEKPASRLVRKKTPRETMLATFKAEGWPNFEGKWYYVGPFDNTNKKAFGTIYPPENGFDLSKTYPAKGKELVGWHELTTFRAGDVVPLGLFPANDFNCIYLYHAFESGADRSVPVSLGSTDGLELWLNGKRILARNASRRAAPDQEQVALEVKAGKNELLVKVCNGTSPSAFYLMPQFPLAWLKEENLKPAVFLSDLPETNPSVGVGRFGKHGRLGIDGHKIVVGGTESPQGISLHPASKGVANVTYRLGKHYHVFRGTAAINDVAAKDSASPLTFSVHGDGKVLWRSPPLQKRGETAECLLLISGVDVLLLKVQCPGPKDNAHAVWVEPRVLE